MRTFADLFCEQHQLAPEEFTDAVFRRCLFRRAWVVAPVILLLNRDYFAEDFEFVARIGRVTTVAQLREKLKGFRLHPWHEPFLRRLKIRVSGRRAAALVTAAWQATAPMPSVGSANSQGAA